MYMASIQHTYMVTVHNTCTWLLYNTMQVSQSYPHNNSNVESSCDRENQTAVLEDGNQEESNTHIYHILEPQTKEDEELENTAAPYEVSVVNMASHP